MSSRYSEEEFYILELVNSATACILICTLYGLLTPVRRDTRDLFKIVALVPRQRLTEGNPMWHHNKSRDLTQFLVWAQFPVTWEAICRPPYWGIVMVLCNARYHHNCHVTLVLSIVKATPLAYQDVTLHHKYPFFSQHPTHNRAKHRSQLLVRRDMSGRTG